jgi:hypothetical protein
MFFMGHLLELPTLNSILEQYQIKSNAYQINYNKLLKKMSNKTFFDVFEQFGLSVVRTKLLSMAEKDASIWSKTSVTVIVDDSIFKQWLGNLLREDIHYNSYFSGQFQKTVYGFKIVCLGLSIDGFFYPLFIDFAQKAPKESSKEEGKAFKSSLIAEKLVEKWGLFFRKLQAEQPTLSDLYFSCDNGYNDVNLSEKCHKNGLIYISVPKKSHYFEIEGKKQNLTKFIEEKYLPQEKKHELDYEKAKNDWKKLQEEQKINEVFRDSTPYTWRIKAKYCSQGREVVLLFFRLNGSSKVSVIYCTQLTIFSKTLRHHWYDRTYIEQFFKLLKHTMQIQQAKTSSKETFEVKLVGFLFLAWQLQKLVAFLRKSFDFGVKRKIGLHFIRKQLIQNSDLAQVLADLLQNKIKKM